MSLLEQKKILILGASGVIGSELVRYFLQQKQQVVIKTRSINKLLAVSPKHTFYSNLAYYHKGLELVENLSLVNLTEFKTIINLTGEPIFTGFWTKSKKLKLYNSRIDTTAEIVAKINQEDFKGVFFSASASGIYGDRGCEVLTEDSRCEDNSFIEKLCIDWEQQALKINLEKQNDVTIIILRTSIVLSAMGGFLPQMLKLYKYNLGAILGSGKQYLSWISINDYVRAVAFLNNLALAKKIKNPLTVNMSSPKANTAQEIHQAFKSLNNQFKFGRFKLFNLNYAKIPKFVVKLIFGEKSSLLLFSARLLPLNLLNFGFNFTDLDLRDTLQKISRQNNN